MQEVHTLICHNDIEMALSCLGSLVKYSADPLRLVFHDDGSLTSEDEYILSKNFASSGVVWRKDADDFMNESLKNYPNCQKFRDENIMALKLFDISLYATDKIAYCDTDVLFFRPFRGLYKFHENESAIFMMDHQEAYSLYPWQLLGPNKLNIVSRLNAGMLFVKKESFDLEFIEWFLSNVRFRSIPVWIEQTCWAALAYRISCRLWNPELLRVITKKTVIPDVLVAGHFARSVRCKMRSFLQGDLIENDNINYIQQINTIDSSRCRFIDIAKERVVARIGRMFS